jgi:peptide/nickel transport system permease protein
VQAILALRLHLYDRGVYRLVDAHFLFRVDVYSALLGLAGRIQEVPWLVASCRRVYNRRCALTMMASWLPNDRPGSPLDRFLHLIMPVTVLTIINVPSGVVSCARRCSKCCARIMCARRAPRGWSSGLVINKHALRNALDPLHHRAGAEIPWPFCRCDLDRNGFAWPGMGRLFFDALQRRTTTLRWRSSTSRRF